MPIKAVLFDLDNTLFDFLRMKRESCAAAVEAMVDAGLGMRKDEALKLLFALYDKHGIEYSRIFQEFLKAEGKLTAGSGLREGASQTSHRILAEGIVAYRRAQLRYVKPYPGAVQTLLKLKERGLRLGIVSDAPAVNAWIRMVEMGLPDFFDVIVTFDDTGERKPSKKPFAIALGKLKVAASEVLYVGDWPERDIAGAKSLGMRTAFAKYGSAARSHGADFELEQVSDVLKVVERL